MNYTNMKPHQPNIELIKRRNQVLRSYIYIYILEMIESDEIKLSNTIESLVFGILLEDKEKES